MGCGCNKGNTGTAKKAAPAAGGQLFEVMDGTKIVHRTRVEAVAKQRAEAIPGGRYRPSGQP